MSELDVLFIGGLYPKENEKEVLSNCIKSPQQAANFFQWSLIDGFEENIPGRVTLLNQMFIGSYPKNHKKAFIREEKFEHVRGANDINLGFCNITILKNFLPAFREKLYIKKWITTHKDNGVVFIYSLNKRFVRVAKYIKKISPSTAIIISINDLPEHIMQEQSNKPIVKLWKRYLSQKVRHGLQYIDGFMPVASQQIDRLSLPPSKCQVIEVITPTKNRNFRPIIDSEKKRIIYAGTLARQYNIMDLVDAFEKVRDDELQLVICGDGDAREDVKIAAEKDKRILYLGVLPKEDVDELLLTAWVLVNPRNSGQIFTAYSFPIKTIDYLSAGRPVLCQKLEAYTSEYDKHLIYYESGDQNEGLVNAIETVTKFPLEKVNELGKGNFDFAMREKGAKIQTQKIIELYEKIRGDKTI